MYPGNLEKDRNQIIMENMATPLDFETVIDTIPVKDNAEDEGKRR